MGSTFLGTAARISLAGLSPWVQEPEAGVNQADNDPFRMPIGTEKKQITKGVLVCKAVKVPENAARENGLIPISKSDRPQDRSNSTDRPYGSELPGTKHRFRKREYKK